jgi:hypothetical protein
MSNLNSFKLTHSRPEIPLEVDVGCRAWWIRVCGIDALAAFGSGAGTVTDGVTGNDWLKHLNLSRRGTREVIRELLNGADAGVCHDTLGNLHQGAVWNIAIAGYAGEDSFVFGELALHEFKNRLFFWLHEWASSNGCVAFILAVYGY